MSKLSLIFSTTPTIAERKAEKHTAIRKNEREVSAFIKHRSGGWCECCLGRRGQSRHERRFKSLGGKVTNENSMWVCGSGTTGCHGHLQRLEILPKQIEGGRYIYEPNPNNRTQRAAKWLEAGWKAFDLGYEGSDRPTHRMQQAV